MAFVVGGRAQAFAHDTRYHRSMTMQGWMGPAGSMRAAMSHGPGCLIATGPVALPPPLLHLLEVQIQNLVKRIDVGTADAMLIEGALHTFASLLAHHAIWRAHAATVVVERGL